MNRYIISTIILALLLLSAGCLETPTKTIDMNKSAILGDAHVKGEGNIIVVAFSDYQCPYCKKSFEYEPKSGVQFGFRNFPLTSIHPLAYIAAIAAECAGEQGKFWEAHDWLFSHEWSSESEIVDGVGSVVDDSSALQKCVAIQGESKKIEDDKKLAETFEVRGTPTYLIIVPDESSAKRISNLIDGRVFKGNDFYAVEAVGAITEEGWKRILNTS